MLVKVANKDTESVVSALIKQSQRLPSELYRSLTWNRGKELADYQRLTLATEVEVYFCDPRSPLAAPAQTKTPTDCCANIFHAGLICPCIAKPNSARSQGSSMKGPERPCSIKPQQTSSRNVLQRPVEPAAQSGRSPKRRRRLSAHKPTCLDIHSLVGRAGPRRGFERAR